MGAVIDTYGVPPASLLREYDGCCRYLSRVTGGKSLTAEHVDFVHGMNKTIVQNFEDSADNAKGGHGQGLADAQFSLDLIRQLGSPRGTAVYFSVDFEIHSGFGTVDDYVRACRQVLRPAGYKVGVYGCYDLIRHLFDAGLIDYGWQCAAWSYGALDARAHLYQNQYEGSYDVNQIQHADYGAWTPTGAQRPLPTDPFDLLMEQLMQWYKTKADFEKSMKALMAEAVDEGPLHTFNVDPHGDRRSLSTWLSGIPGYVAPAQRKGRRKARRK